VSLKDLPEQARERLKRLQQEIQVDKVTVSFSIENRTFDGRKVSAFFASTASRGHLSNEGPTDQGWGLDDCRLVTHLLSKEVVFITYQNAVRQRVMSASQAKKELVEILKAYDEDIRKRLEKERVSGSKET
jgi:hypothetical protein